MSCFTSSLESVCALSSSNESAEREASVSGQERARLGVKLEELQIGA
jgi:hypothetical protein